MNKILTIILVATITSIISISFYHQIAFKKLSKSTPPKVVYINNSSPSIEATETKPNGSLVRLASQKWTDKAPPSIPNFVDAASKTSPAVVFITTYINNDVPMGNSYFFGQDKKRSHSNSYEDWGTEIEPDETGSGVIVSHDGYIVTNEHVIRDKRSIFVTMQNKQSYTATVVGKDTDTDLALLKIEDKGLPYLRYGDSDKLNVGEWVLAIGNPFNLTSTVTAGIVSAKSRNINVLETESAIEFFIQTDAAINPGNSGGPLVNTRGELVGINTAIATPSGTFMGYSFAIPVNVVSKVIEDLKVHGVSQRPYLGVNVKDIDADLAKRLELKKIKGIYVEQVIKNSAADDANLKKGDIIIEVNGYAVNSAPELQEKIARYRPGDPIGVTYMRNGQNAFVEVILKNDQQDMAVIRKPKEELGKSLGADFEELSVKEMRKLGLRNGIKVLSISDYGILKEFTEMQKGFIIVKVNNIKIKSVDAFLNSIKNTKQKHVMVEGFYPYGINTKRRLYAFPFKK